MALPSKAGAMRQIAPEYSSESSAKSLPHYFACVVLEDSLLSEFAAKPIANRKPWQQAERVKHWRTEIQFERSELNIHWQFVLLELFPWQCFIVIFGLTLWWGQLWSYCVSLSLLAYRLFMVFGTQMELREHLANRIGFTLRIENIAICDLERFQEWSGFEALTWDPLRRTLWGVEFPSSPFSLNGARSVLARSINAPIQNMMQKANQRKPKWGLLGAWTFTRTILKVSFAPVLAIALGNPLEPILGK